MPVSRRGIHDHGDPIRSRVGIQSLGTGTRCSQFVAGLGRRHSRASGNPRQRHAAIHAPDTRPSLIVARPGVRSPGLWGAGRHLPLDTVIAGRAYSPRGVCDLGEHLAAGPFFRFPAFSVFVLSAERGLSPALGSTTCKVPPRSRRTSFLDRTHRARREICATRGTLTAPRPKPVRMASLLLPTVPSLNPYRSRVRISTDPSGSV